VVNSFWVDLYLNPDPAPNGVNQIWHDGRSKEGAAWGVDGAILAQLTPGGEITLTTGDEYYDPKRTRFDGFEPGDVIYVQVDSLRADTDYGNVLENHELDSLPYNNITGPVDYEGVGEMANEVDKAELSTFLKNRLPRRRR
jgi:hypothetical protein